MNFPAVSTSPVRIQVTPAPVSVAIIRQTKVFAKTLLLVYMLMNKTNWALHILFSSIIA